MRVAVFEDERPARDRLCAALARCAPDAVIVAALGSVREATAWLRAQPAPDLVLADIELADGVSLAIFEAVPLSCPVVFCTAYDEYLTSAMRHNGIDYLLKPIDEAELAGAIAKYRRFEAHFGARVAGLSRELAGPRVRQRMLVRRGAAFVSVPVDEIAYFVTEHRLVLLVDHGGASYAVDRTLSELEAELDPDAFFRVSRGAIVAQRAVVSFASELKGRLSLELKPPGPALLVSPDRARRFRAWLDR